MDVRIYAFELTFGGEIKLTSFEDFLKRLGRYHSKKIADFLEKGGKKPEIREVILVGRRKEFPDYVVGLNLTIKDISAFCSLKLEKGKLAVSAQALERGTLMTDFNFFVIYEPTGRGLYQHYHHSPATTTFCKLLNDRYLLMVSGLVKKKALDMVEKSNGEIDIESATKEIEKKYISYLKTEVIERPGSMGDMIMELKKIKRLTIEPYSYDRYTRFARPDKPIFKKIKQIIHFDGSVGTLVDYAKEYAANLVSKNTMRSAIAKGVDINGNEATIKLNKDYQVLSTYDYDDLIAKINLKDLTESIEDAKIITELLNLTQSRNIKTLIETPAE